MLWCCTLCRLYRLLGIVYSVHDLHISAAGLCTVLAVQHAALTCMCVGSQCRQPFPAASSCVCIFISFLKHTSICVCGACQVDVVFEEVDASSLACQAHQHMCVCVCVACQVDVVFEEVDEIALQDAGLPFVAGRLAEPIQPQLLRMRTLLAASKCNVVLVDGIEKVHCCLFRLLPSSACVLLCQTGV